MTPPCQEISVPMCSNHVQSACQMNTLDPPGCKPRWHDHIFPWSMCWCETPCCKNNDVTAQLTRIHLQSNVCNHPNHLPFRWSSSWNRNEAPRLQSPGFPWWNEQSVKLETRHHYRDMKNLLLIDSNHLDVVNSNITPGIIGFQSSCLFPFIHYRLGYAQWE